MSRLRVSGWVVLGLVVVGAVALILASLGGDDGSPADTDAASDPSEPLALTSPWRTTCERIFSGKTFELGDLGILARECDSERHRFEMCLLRLHPEVSSLGCEPVEGMSTLALERGTLRGPGERPERHATETTCELRLGDSRVDVTTALSGEPCRTALAKVCGPPGGPSFFLAQGEPSLLLFADADGLRRVQELPAPGVDYEMFCQGDASVTILGERDLDVPIVGGDGMGDPRAQEHTRYDCDRNGCRPPERVEVEPPRLGNVVPLGPWVVASDNLRDRDVAARPGYQRGELSALPGAPWYVGEEDGPRGGFVGLGGRALFQIDVQGQGGAPLTFVFEYRDGGFHPIPPSGGPLPRHRVAIGSVTHHALTGLSDARVAQLVTRTRGAAEACLEPGDIEPGASWFEVGWFRYEEAPVAPSMYAVDPSAVRVAACVARALEPLALDDVERQVGSRSSLRVLVELVPSDT